mmetsp:Transcript_53792/g.117008  ORF Transcript_53792/g.117008 Transcript_53792/m.117008 type:complete len:145 (+) Transcript_53792:333-767(+)
MQAHCLNFHRVDKEEPAAISSPHMTMASGDAPSATPLAIEGDDIEGDDLFLSEAQPVRAQAATSGSYLGQAVGNIGGLLWGKGTAQTVASRVAQPVADELHVVSTKLRCLHVVCEWLTSAGYKRRRARHRGGGRERRAHHRLFV